MEVRIEEINIYEIREGDILIFPNRKEVVKKMDSILDILFTRRTNFFRGWEIKEQVAYNLSKGLFPNSRGSVYDSIRYRIPGV